MSRTFTFTIEYEMTPPDDEDWEVWESRIMLEFEAACDPGSGLFPGGERTRSDVSRIRIKEPETNIEKERKIIRWALATAGALIVGSGMWFIAGVIIRRPFMEQVFWWSLLVFVPSFIRYLTIGETRWTRPRAKSDRADGL